MLHRLPTFAIVQLHPIVFTVLDLARILESLSKEFSEVVVVWGVLKPEIPDVAQVFVEFVCNCDSV